MEKAKSDKIDCRQRKLLPNQPTKTMQQCEYDRQTDRGVK